MNYYIKTFGCQMNIHESEKLAGMLNSLGYNNSVDNPKDADRIIEIESALGEVNITFEEVI